MNNDESYSDYTMVQSPGVYGNGPAKRREGIGHNKLKTVIPS